MNGSISHRPYRTRNVRTYKIAPATRAIRAALAASATMLALGGSGFAIAAPGTCTLVGTTETCTGDFTTGVPTVTPVADMTLVVDAGSTITPPAGTDAIYAEWSGDVTVTSSAAITANSNRGVAVFSYSGGNAAFSNYGDLSDTYTGSWVVGAQAQASGGTGNASLTNGGSISATGIGSTKAYGVGVWSDGGYANVTNQATGSISAVSDTGNVFGVEVGTFDGAVGYGDITVVNDGRVYAATGGYGSAIGINAYTSDTYGNVAVTNNGDVGAYAFIGYATGVSAYAYNNDASVTNSGTGNIVAESEGGNAYGAVATSINGNASIGNAGSIYAYSFNPAGDYVYGAMAVSTNGNASIDNASTGTISADSVAGNATGARAYSYLGNASVDNAGSISATSTSGSATGVYAGGQDGDATINNSGTISATGFAGATGVYAYSDNGSATVTNAVTGTISSYSLNGDAFGAKAGSYSEAGTTSVDIDNAGSIYAGSHNGNATGAYAYSDDYNTSSNITNASTGTISAYSYDGNATGAYAFSDDGSTSIDNAGTISAVSIYGSSSGVRAYSYGGEGNFRYYSVDATVTNSGAISATGDTGATGVYARSNYGDATVSNTATGSITATTTYGNAIGVSAASYGGNYYGYYYGNTDVTNAGSISASSVHGNAAGVLAYSEYGHANVTNSGSIAATSTYGDALGVSAYSVYWNANVTNAATGTITATGYDGATGVYAESYSGEATIDNAGSITATTLYGTAIGASAYSDILDANITNSGSISATSYDGYAGGADASSHYGDANVSNAATGSIAATSTYYNAYGVYANSDFGDAHVTNAGTIAGTATYADAFGVFAYSHYSDVFVTNSGSIAATATYGDATGVSATSNSGDAYVTNAATGSISATAGGNDYEHATGVYAGGYNASVYQAGAISASATGVYGGDAVGVFVGGYNNVGFTSAAGSTTDATASGYYEAYATGVLAEGPNVTVDAGGEISATATADSVYGEAVATGLGVFGNYTTATTQAGSSISATASGYDAYAIGLAATGFDTLALVNGGDITALATGVYGDATGMFGVNKYAGGGTFTSSNSGDITAEFDGAYGHAYGAVLDSLYGDVVFTNYGHISATTVGSAYDAVGVYLEAGTGLSTTLYNIGTITADIAVQSGASTDTIVNTGTINGAIVTGDGNDTLYNNVGGVWNPGSAVTSYFGTGDDSIFNAGTINMVDSTIDLGEYTLGNHFENTGLITASGVDNYIFMDNPYPFINNGTISFQDGAPDDMLTIVGDFAGDGQINMDVSGLHTTSDLLYIEGNVADGSTNTINVNLLDLPTTATSKIPMVDVTGDSVAGSFALGTVNYSPINFLTLDFGLVSDIDTSNATNDVFSLGTTVTGLSDPGTLTASIVPGAQSLMNSEIGTWRQRMGVINKFQSGGVSPWIRVFSDSGTIDPGHVASNFGQGGNFQFDQKNTGVEGGVDYAFSDEFSLGLLLGKAHGNQSLNAGVGTSKINGDTYGLYGTWISPGGFYLDTSYRHMNFDARMNSIAGEKRVSGDAKAFNVEAGYAWTLEGGLKIEPQLQYTHTSVSNIDPVTAPLATFLAHGGDSSRGRVGVSFRKSFGDVDNVLWTPYATISAVREFDGKNSYSINNNFFGYTDTSGTSALLELGATAQMHDLSIFGGLNWQDGGALQGVFGGQLGLRYTFGHAPEAAPAPVAAPPPPPAKTCADMDDDGDGVNNCIDKCPNSTAGQAVGPDGCPVPLTIDLKGVNFDFDKATLRPDSIATLDEAISVLSKYPDMKVEVAGHTDSIGTEIYNQGLSERRAKAVYDYLTSHGVTAGRLIGPVGYGETRPIAPNTNPDGSDNPEGRAQNRRTELNVENDQH
jgi:outer membrane autotransporter protein